MWPKVLSLLSNLRMLKKGMDGVECPFSKAFPVSNAGNDLTPQGNYFNL
jgi:hypothetical protein